MINVTSTSEKLSCKDKKTSGEQANKAKHLEEPCLTVPVCMLEKNFISAFEEKERVYCSFRLWARSQALTQL